MAQRGLGGPGRDPRPLIRPASGPGRDPASHVRLPGQCSRACGSAGQGTLSPPAAALFLDAKRRPGPLFSLLCRHTLKSFSCPALCSAPPPPRGCRKRAEQIPPPYAVTSRLAAPAFELPAWEACSRPRPCLSADLGRLPAIA